MHQNIFYLKNISSNSGFVSLSGNICLTQLRRRATPAPSRFEAIPVETSSLELTTPFFYPQLYSGYIPNYIPGSSFLLLRFPAPLNSSPDDFDSEENWSYGTSSQTLVDVYNVCTYTCIGPNWRVSISICNCLITKLITCGTNVQASNILILSEQQVHSSSHIFDMLAHFKLPHICLRLEIKPSECAWKIWSFFRRPNFSSKKTSFKPIDLIGRTG